MTPVRIGLVGDFRLEVVAHGAIPPALTLAAGAVGCEVQHTWIATERITSSTGGDLLERDALWCVPGSPYASMEGALRAIRYARECRRPFLGTCGGFQHALIEYARNVAGLTEADHAESSPAAAAPVISPLACSLVGQTGVIRLRAGSRIRDIYGRAEITEAYHCRFGLNPEYRKRLESSGLKFTGFDEQGEVRVFELADHPFFVGTLFQPERSALRGEIHPLIRAFVQTARGT